MTDKERVIVSLDDDAYNVFARRLPGWFRFNGRDIFLKTKSDLINELLIQFERNISRHLVNY